jgi:hypothetical protein
MLHMTLATDPQHRHTRTMSLKNAAVLALIGMLLLTILVAADFIRNVSGVIGGFVPAMALLRSLVYLFASLTVTVFFWVFSRAQSR